MMIRLTPFQFSGLFAFLILSCLSQGCFDSTISDTTGSIFTQTTLPTLSGPETMALASERGHWVDGVFTHWTPGNAWNGEWSDVPAHPLRDLDGNTLALFYFDKHEATSTQHLMVEWLTPLPAEQENCALELRGSTEDGERAWSLWLGVGEAGIHLEDGQPSSMALSVAAVSSSPLGESLHADAHLMAEASFPAHSGEFRWTVRGPSETSCTEFVQTNAVLIGESGEVGEPFWIQDSTQGEAALASVEPPGSTLTPILHLSGDFTHVEDPANLEVFFVNGNNTASAMPIYATSTDIWVPNLPHEEGATLTLAEGTSLAALPLRSNSHGGALNRRTSQNLLLDGGWSQSEDEYMDVTPIMSGDTTIWATRSDSTLQLLLAPAEACEGNLASDLSLGANLFITASGESVSDVVPEGIEVMTGSGERPDGTLADTLIEVSISADHAPSQMSWLLFCEGLGTTHIRIDTRAGAIGIYPSSAPVAFGVSTLPWHESSQLLLRLDGISFGNTVGTIDALANGESHALQVHSWEDGQVVALMDLSIGQTLESVSLSLSTGETLQVPTGPQCGHVCDEEILP
jgi:hypothetical protein